MNNGRNNFRPPRDGDLQYKTNWPRENMGKIRRNRRFLRPRGLWALNGQIAVDMADCRSKWGGDRAMAQAMAGDGGRRRICR